VKARVLTPMPVVEGTYIEADVVLVALEAED
jgi:hypothetical protein